jgi:hypothetical protein
MKSTGEVMGIDVDLGLAFAKSQMAAQPSLPAAGNVFISVKDGDKERVLPIAREFVGLNFGIISTGGTAAALAAAGIPVTKVYKLREGRPNVLDRVKNGDINFIINTPSGKIPREDEVTIRNASLARRIPIMTTIRAAQASANGIRSLQKHGVTVTSLQEYHASVVPAAPPPRRTVGEAVSFRCFRDWGSCSFPYSLRRGARRALPDSAPTAAATTHQREQEQCADDRHDDRSEAAETIREEGEHVQ